MKGLVTLSVLALTANAQFFNPFGHHQQQQQQQQQKTSYETEFLNNDCDKFLCPDTQACVKSSVDCPCPFPKSQLKCMLPDKKSFQCISKPATNNEVHNAIYDDPVKGPKASIDGLRDCGWVTKAYNGLV